MSKDNEKWECLVVHFFGKNIFSFSVLHEPALKVYQYLDTAW